MEYFAQIKLKVSLFKTKLICPIKKNTKANISTQTYKEKFMRFLRLSTYLVHHGINTTILGGHFIISYLVTWLLDKHFYRNSLKWPHDQSFSSELQGRKRRKQTACSYTDICSAMVLHCSYSAAIVLSRRSIGEGAHRSEPCMYRSMCVSSAGKVRAM